MLPKGSALIVTSEINQRWLTGFEYTDGYVLVTHGESFLITDFRYIEAARADADPGFTVYMPEGRSMLTAIGEMLAGEGITRVAIEDGTLPVSDLERFKEKFPGIEFVTGGSALLDGLREFKDADEI